MKKRKKITHGSHGGGGGERTPLALRGGGQLPVHLRPTVGTRGGGSGGWLPTLLSPMAGPEQICSSSGPRPPRRWWLAAAAVTARSAPRRRRRQRAPTAVLVVLVCFVCCMGHLPLSGVSTLIASAY